MTNPFGALGLPILQTLGRPAAITVTRRAAGSYVDGSWVAGAPTTFPVSAFVEPVQPRELAQLPEGEETSEAIAIFTADALRTSDVDSQTEADRVAWEGRSYRVVLVEDWTAQAKYARAVAVRVGGV